MIYSPGEVPAEVLNRLSETGKTQVAGCHASVTDKGTLFYKVNFDHVMIVLIIGSATQAVFPLRALYDYGLPIFFLGHTPHVIEWGKKHCEEVGILFRYKEHHGRSCQDSG